MEVGGGGRRVRENTYQIAHYALLCVPEEKKKEDGGGRRGEVMNALSLRFARATYLLCLKRYLLNSALALRSRIMITVHLDKLHSGNPFVKIWSQLEAGGGGDTSSLQHPSSSRWGWVAGCACKATRCYKYPIIPCRLHTL